MESKYIAPETKTAEEILREEYEKIAALSSDLWGKWEEEDESIKMGINAMRRFADQEKRKEAAAFVRWSNEKTIREGSDLWKWSGDNYKGRYSTDQLYDLYLLSLTNS